MVRMMMMMKELQDEESRPNRGRARGLQGGPSR
jgi:hypothetical protein